MCSQLLHISDCRCFPGLASPLAVKEEQRGVFAAAVMKGSENNKPKTDRPADVQEDKNAVVSEPAEKPASPGETGEAGG